ncbi:MAG TPA: RHS repeat-associated core domain-containing protein [Trebonia sp.]|nr:RHS repeat-associated core domain-containing protein [Trebonia sp.]
MADNQVPDQDVYTFNGLGDQVQDASLEYGNTISTTTTVYNGDRTTVIPPAGGVTKATVTDPLGRTSATDEYTAAPTLHVPSNTFTGTWYLTGGTTTATSYGYDGHGNQSTITDASGHAWTTTYNLLGQPTTKADPDAGTTTGMTYDGDGNLLQETTADGKTTSYTYDALSRKTAEYAAASGSGTSSNEIASWVYDNSNDAVSGMKYPVGQLTTEASYSGGSAYTIQQAGFNVFGESLGETVTIPSATGTAGLSGSYSFGHTYTTGVGLPFDDKYPAAGGLPAETTAHTYLATPLDLASGLGGTIDGYAQSTTYDAYGDATQEEIGTGSNLAYITNTYDPHTLRLTEQLTSRSVDTPADVDEEQYSYDLDGNPTSQASTRLGSSTQTETQCFQYNGLDQLSAAWTATDACAATPTSSSHSTVGDGLGSASEYWTTWSYDVLGDMQTQDQHSLTGGTDTTTTDTYGGTSGGPNALTSAATTGGSTSTSTFGFDAAGNMTASGTPANGSQAMTWTADGKLATATGSKGTTSYVYDADGNLLLQENPGSTILYLPGEQLTATTSGSTTTVAGARIIALPSGGDVVRTGATTSYYFEVPDRQGTNELYLDNTAQVPAWRQFTPYGAPRGTTVTWIDNRGYLNKPADPDTGLTYIGARAYDTVTAQFISPDPILKPSDPQDLNPYDYAEDNPETNSDPTGDMVYEDGGGCNGSACYDGGGSQAGGNGTVLPSSPSFSEWSGPSPSWTSRVRRVVSDLFSLHCPGVGCTPINAGGTFGGLAVPFRPAVANAGKIRVLQRMYSNAAWQVPDAGDSGGAGGHSIRELLGSQGQYEGARERLITATRENTGELMNPGYLGRIGNGLNILGGAVSAYGEYNETNGNWTKTLGVGGSVTAVNYGAGVIGADVATGATGVLAGLAAGAEEGSMLGALGGPGGVVVGALAGAVVGGILGWAGGGAVGSLFNGW